jgi:hypothetical protein
LDKCKNIYQLVIDNLLREAAIHQERATAVTIFDTVRLIELGKAKVLKERAEDFQGVLDTITKDFDAPREGVATIK